MFGFDVSMFGFDVSMFEFDVRCSSSMFEPLDRGPPSPEAPIKAGEE